MMYRWVFCHRRMHDVARLLAKEKPRIGDELLGVIELASGTGDQNASPALCQAAIEQVAVSLLGSPRQHTKAAGHRFGVLLP